MNKKQKKTNLRKIYCQSRSQHDGVDCIFLSTQWHDICINCIANNVLQHTHTHPVTNFTPFIRCQNYIYLIYMLNFCCVFYVLTTKMFAPSIYNYIRDKLIF